MRIAGYAIWARMSVPLWLVWLWMSHPGEPNSIRAVCLCKDALLVWATKDLSVRFRIDETRLLRRQWGADEPEPSRRPEMPISFSMIILSSQLVIAVADQVPKFDIAKSCKLDVAATTGLTANQPVKSCMNDEQKAQQQLATQWSTFPAANKAQCGSMEAIGDTPSYVSLLTCLQMDQIAK